MFEFMALVNMLMLGVHPRARVDNANRREQFFMGVLYPNGGGGDSGISSILLAITPKLFTTFRYLLSI